MSKDINNFIVVSFANLPENLLENFAYHVNRKTTIETVKLARSLKEAHIAMSDLNRGIMKFAGADSPKAVTISTVLLLGSIAALIIWALQAAYAVN